MDEESITFSQEDVEGVKFPHNDVMVITLIIEDYNVHYLLVNNESLVDVWVYNAFSIIGIPLKWLERVDDR